MGVFDTIGQVAGIGQSVFNLGDSLFGISANRAKNNALELQESQYGYNKQLQDAANAFNRESQLLQNQFESESQAKQFAMNLQLNNAGRDAFDKRMAGLNPAENTASYGGSVGLPSISSPGSAPSSVGSSPFGIQSNPNPSTLFADLASARKLESEKLGIDVDNMTRLEKNKSEIFKNVAEAYKDMKDGKISEELYRIRKAEADNAIRSINAKINALNAQAGKDDAIANIQDRSIAATEKTAAAAETTAEANKIRADNDTKRLEFESAQVKINEYVAKTGRLQYEIDKEKLPSFIENIQSLTRQYNALSDKTGAEAKQIGKLMHEQVKNLAIKNKYLDRKEQYEILKIAAETVESASRSNKNIFDSASGMIDAIVPF